MPNDRTLGAAPRRGRPRAHARDGACARGHHARRMPRRRPLVPDRVAPRESKDDPARGHRARPPASYSMRPSTVQQYYVLRASVCPRAGPGRVDQNREFAAGEGDVHVLRVVIQLPYVVLPAYPHWQQTRRQGITSEKPRDLAVVRHANSTSGVRPCRPSSSCMTFALQPAAANIPHTIKYNIGIYSNEICRGMMLDARHVANAGENPSGYIQIRFSLEYVSGYSVLVLTVLT